MPAFVGCGAALLVIRAGLGRGQVGSAVHGCSALSLGSLPLKRPGVLPAMAWPRMRGSTGRGCSGQREEGTRGERPAWRKVLSLAGTGQNRPGLPAYARRKWSDPFVTSHVAFLPGIVIACTKSPPLPELAAIQSLVLGLSVMYHRDYERPSPVATAEGLFAKLLFAYGTVQTCYSPTDVLLAANSLCFLLTAGTFVLTNIRPSLYERWHPLGLHLVPGLWATLVSLFHTSLLPPAL
jgi:hypothetical protein